jgi:hypothetical protein
MNEEEDMDGGKNVDEGEEINVGRNCVSRDDQKVIHKLMNMDQHSTRQYPMVSDMTDSESDVNTNDIEVADGSEIVSKSNASTPVKLVATSSDAILDSRKKRDAPLIDDILVPTVMCTLKPLTTSKRSVDATPNDTRNTVSITVPNITVPVPKKDQPLLEFSTKSVDDTVCKSVNNEDANLDEDYDMNGNKNMDDDKESNVAKDIARSKNIVNKHVQKRDQKIIPKLKNVDEHPAQQYSNKKHRSLHEFSTRPSIEIHKADQNLTKLSRKIFDKDSNIREVMRELHLLLKDGKPEKLDGAEIDSNISTPVIASNTSTPVELVAALSDVTHTNRDEREEPVMSDSPTKRMLTFPSSSSPLCDSIVPETCTPKPGTLTTSKRPDGAIPSDTRNAEAPVSIRAPYVAVPAPKKHQSFELSTNSSDDTTCKSLNNEAVNLNEGNESDGAKN